MALLRANTGIGTTNPTSALHVLGDGRFTGVVTASTFIGQINAGVSTLGVATATQLIAQQLTVSGVVTATSFIGDGSGLTGIIASGSGGIAIKNNGSVVGTAGTIDFESGLSVSPVSAGVVTVSTNINYVSNSGVSTYASIAGIATYASTAGIATYSSVAGVSTYATSAGIATYASVSGVSTYATSAGIATYATSAGISTYAITAGVSTSVIGGIGSIAQLSVSGVSTLTGNTFVGSAITMYASTGIISATTFYGNVVGNITGSIANATNLTGGTANASSLNVSGIATISAGRIQADAGSNLRFGNLPAGSGSSGRNIAIGDQVLVSLSGGSGRNIGIGELSYYDTTSGQYNIGLGIQAGQKITTGSYNVIIGGYNGQTGLDLRTSSNNVVISDGQGNIRQYFDSNGNVGIKTTVITEALTVSGIVSATSYSGSGIGLTNIPASQLTGILPAIDGSNLFGVTATGSGIQIRDDGSIVGTAATIDFGSNLSVSFASGIATVSGASSVSAATTAYALAGSPNLNVGVVTATNLKVINSSKTTNIGETYIEIGEGVGSNLGPTYIDFHGPGGSSDYSTRFIQYKQSDIDTGNVGGFEILVGNNHTNPFRIKNVSNGYKYFDTISNSVQLYNSDNKKFETTGYGISVYGGVNAPTGIITASSFSGSGSGLTNLPSGQLTGALPALDGSALINLPAQPGDGINVKDDGTSVGSARTVDFGSGLDVTISGGIATVTASSGSLQSRTIVTGITTSIVNNGIGNTNITGFKSYALMKVGLSTAGWLRIYTDSTSRANDVSRSVGEDPAPGSGVIAEVITTGISTTQIISPFVMGGNLDNPADTTIYASITNLSGSTQAITANLTILQLEA